MMYQLASMGAFRAISTIHIILLLRLDAASTFPLLLGQQGRSSFVSLAEAPPSSGGNIFQPPASAALEERGRDEECEECESSSVRRLLVGATLTSVPFLGPVRAAEAAGVVPELFGGRLRGQSRPDSLYVVTPEKNLTDSLQKEFVSAPTPELCLLRLLPQKNTFFKKIGSTLEGFSRIGGTTQPDPDVWKQATKLIDSIILELDNKRSTIEPVFNPEDPAIMQIQKAERGEQLIDSLRGRLVGLQETIKASNITGTKIQLRKAFLALSKVGELLVSSFPYDVPTEGKFSYLPRLLGRAEVTFSIRRRNSLLGNITVIADGFAAPVTAGNFVDLSLRNFYSGLPIKFSKKRLSSGSDFEVANIPILGTYNEGFYDPLTAQVRRIPLELIRIEKNSNSQSLAYAQGLTALTGQQASVEPSGNSKPLLSFEIPGLVAMNHREKDVNGASSEFFCLQENSVAEGKRTLLDGEYAPFGFIIDGFDLFQHLQPNDVIDSTSVDEWGELNLVKLRRSSFSEVVQGSEENEKP